MSNFFKNTKKLALVMSSILLAITLAAGSFAYVTHGLPIATEQGSSEPGAEETGVPEESPEELDAADAAGETDGDLPGFTQVSTEPVFNRPAEMRGVYLVPGYDFIKKVDVTDSTIKAEIDKAVESAAALEMNSVIIDTVWGDKVIFNTQGAPSLYGSFDAMEYLVGRCREAGLYVYAIFDASLMGGDDADKLSESAYAFAMEYQPDGVLIDGYETASSNGSFADYTAGGGSIGFDNYMRQAAALTVKTVAKAVRRANPSIQAGLLAGAVWANKADNPLGSATKAKHTAYYSGNADTRSYVLNETVDFVAVTAYGSRSDTEMPFGEVAGWWADVASEGGIPLYIVHASGKTGSQEAGWSSKDELANQVAEVTELSGCYGSIFNNLSKLSSAGISFTEQPKEESKTETKNTAAQNMAVQNTDTQSGDVQSEVREVSTTSGGTSGNQLIKEISPTGVVMAESDMSIAISAVAVEGADVYAKINGETVPLEVDDSAQIDEDKHSGFALYTGEYIAPEFDGDDVQILGGVTVYASCDGKSQTMEGAYLATSKKSGDMTPVQITADQARTYPVDPVNNVPSPSYYPLPKGAQDYAVGEEVSYTKASTKETFYYCILASGLRVETKDLKEISSGPDNNRITGLSVTNGSDDYTYITIKTAQKVTYSVSYKGTSFIIEFHNTTSVPKSAALDTNSIFSDATWSDGNTLTLTLNKANCFMGYKGYYDKSGNLVFRFNNPPSSIKQARIAVDPGHGGRDVGTLGYNKNYPESVLTAAIAEKVAEELESRGAEVLLLDSAGVDSKDRPAMAEEFEADLLVSIHCNSAVNTKATGTEVFYFYSFSKPLAVSAAANVSKQLGTTNRGAKPSYYNVTLSPQMTSVLVETGFMSNKAEYEKLMKSSYQKRIAVGVADSLVAAIKSAKTGTTVTGTTVVPEEDDEDYDEDYDEDDTSTSSGNGSVSLSETKLSLKKGEKATLEADADVTWKSSNTSVATVTSKGVVTAKAQGTATITATDKDTDDTATCKVTVKSEGTPGVKIDELYITSGQEKLFVGESVQLEIDYEPSDAYDDSVTWTSSNKSVATVDSNGKVTAVRAGTAEITATSADGGKVKSNPCDIIVTAAPADIADTGIALSRAGEDIYLDYDYLRIYPGNNARVTVIDSDSGEIIRNSDFKWSSDNTAVATVSSTGVVTAKKTGEAMITATYGKNTLECDIEVSTTKVTVKGVSLNKSSMVVVRNRTEQLTATLSPYDATDRSVKWKSSNTKVATVSSSGVVTGRSAGTATITVTTNTGNYTAKCEVEVVRTDVQIEEIEFDMGDTLEMYIGETQEILYTLWPDNVTVKDIVWTSSNTRYATVDANGVVTAVAKGKTTIKATSAKDKKVYAECVVTVYK